MCLFDNLVSVMVDVVLAPIFSDKVWLCSGQSNMFMPIDSIEWAPEGVENAAKVFVKPQQQI